MASNDNNKQDDKSAKRQGVNHNYHDYSMVSAADASLLFSKSSTGGHARQHNPMASASQQQGFAVKLHYMLSAVEACGESDIVSWQPHGRCFVVHDRKAFVERVLSNYFLQSNFASFQRQLNLYGFKRLSSAQDRGGYYHELFLRGRPELSCFIQRIKRKGTGPRKPDSPDSEPDFYAMPYLPLCSAEMQAPTSSFKMNMGNQPPKPVAPRPSFTLKNILPGSLSASPPPSYANGIPATTAIPYYLLEDLPANLLPRQNASVSQYTPQQTESMPDNERNAYATGQILQPTPIGSSARVLDLPHGSSNLYQQQWASPLQPAPSSSSSNAVVMPYGMASNSSGSGAYMDPTNNNNICGDLMTYGMVSMNSSMIPQMASSQPVSSYGSSIDMTALPPLTNQDNSTSNSEAQARNSSGTDTPNSWQNAFGEEEDFWGKLG